jgi:AhpD family alkylhydroperoxidase
MTSPDGHFLQVIGNGKGQGTVQMTQRINIQAVAPGAYNGLYGINKFVGTTGIDKVLSEVVSLRISQINGCAFCLDMHCSALRAAGYPQRNLDVLAAWREVEVFSERERAALAWAEAVTLLPGREVPESVYDEARKVFSEEDLVGLTMSVIAINGWNRLNIAFRNQPAFAEEVALV